MYHKKITQWILTGILASGFFSATSQAAVVFEDLFDQADITALSTRPTPDDPWRVLQYSGREPTQAYISNGLLNITTQEQRFGGATTPLQDSLDFFNQELTYTFSGIQLDAIGQGKPSQQWAKLGVTAGTGSIWYAHSYFIVAFNGAGRFSVQVQQPQVSGRPRVIYIKDFQVPFFNFAITDLSEIKLVLDDTYFRILFTFGNPLDQLSFGGTHGLKRDDWFFDTVGVGRVKAQLDNAQRILDNAIAAGDQVAIDSAQANYDALLADYNAKAAEAEALKGDSALVVSAASNDARVLRFVEGYTDVGAALSIDSIRVETTNTLDVLRNP